MTNCILIVPISNTLSQIYPTELQLNNADSLDTEALFFDLGLSMNNDVLSKIYDKRDDFNFEIVHFPFLDVDVHRIHSYDGVDRV